MKRISLISTLVLISILDTAAQQFATPSQYMLNSTYLNPAYSGEGELYRLTAVCRSQWSGYTDYEGNSTAPAMKLLTGLFNIDQTGHTLGFTLSNDKAAYISNVQAQLSYAYRINLTQRSTVSLGIRGGLLSQTIDFSKYVIKHPDDPLILQQKETELHPDITLGLWLEHEQYFAGISSKGILTSNSYQTPGFRNEPAYILIAGYHLVASTRWRITPSVQIIAAGNNISIDGSVLANYGGIFWSGLSYNHQKSIGAIAGFSILEKKLSISYAFDYVTVNREVTASTSHEVMVNYKIGEFRKNKRSSQNDITSSTRNKS